MAFDWRYFPPFKIAWSSLARLESFEPCNLSIFHDRFSISQLEKVRRFVLRHKKVLSVQFFDVNDAYDFSQFPTLNNNHMAYARLVIPEVLETVDTCIYADVDILFLKGVDAFRFTEEEARTWLIKATVDTMVHLKNDCPWELTEEEETIHYFNSGLIGLNLKELRKIDFTNRALSLANEYKDKIRYHDQTLMNYLLRGRVKYVNSSYNRLFIPTFYRDDPSGYENWHQENVHFVTWLKPWVVFCNYAPIRSWIKAALRCDPLCFYKFFDPRYLRRSYLFYRRLIK